jgi:hypothetical protein
MFATGRKGPIISLGIVATRADHAETSKSYCDAAKRCSARPGTATS